MKIKQNSDCPNKEYNAIFKHIHQNIRAYPRSKTQLLGNYFCILEKIRANRTNTDGGSGRRRNPRKTLQFFPSFKLTKNVFICKYEVNMNIFFPLENWQFNQKLCPLSPTNILCLKDSPQNLTKYEIKETSKVLICLLFNKLGKIQKYNELGKN